MNGSLWTEANTIKNEHTQSGKIYSGLEIEFHPIFIDWKSCKIQGWWDFKCGFRIALDILCNTKCGWKERKLWVSDIVNSIDIEFWMNTVFPRIVSYLE